MMEAKPEWSDQKKWAMGILAALIIGLLGFLGKVVIDLVQPDDQSNEALKREYCDLLAPMLMQLDRTKAAFVRWNSKNLPLEANIILDANEAVKSLLLAQARLIPGELEEHAAKLVEHYDRWLEEYELLRGGPNPNLDETFVFVGPKGYPFPRDSAQKFRTRRDELKSKLGESPCI